MKDNLAYKPKECLRTIQNLFAQPKYKELKIGMRTYIKLMCYVHLAGEQEITGFGRIVNGEIVDLTIPQQEVTGTTADVTDEDMMDFIRSLPIEEIEEWELDWHSHAGMRAFVSGTDAENYELMSMAKAGKQFPILVINRKQEYVCKNYIHPEKTPDIKLTILMEELSNSEIEEIYNECKDEVALKLRMKEIKVEKKVNAWNNSAWNYGKQSKITFKTKNNYQTNLYCSECGAKLSSELEKQTSLCEDCYSSFYGYYQ